MGTPQTIITFGAFTLLIFAVFNMNKNLLENDSLLAQNRYRLEALSIISSHIEQSSLYYFDEASTDTTSQKLIGDYTDPDALGFESNDNWIIDDFDDYNGMVISDTGRSGLVYNLNFKVEYVQMSGTSIVHSNARQYHKRITVSISDSYNPPLIYKVLGGAQVRDTLRLSSVYSYWFYN